MKRILAVVSIICMVLAFGPGTSFAEDYTLTVASSNPSSGVSITVTPNDRNGRGSGTTQFTRTYRENTSVTLTAPATVSGRTFQKWTRNGSDYSTSLATRVTMSRDRTMTAVYTTTTSDTTPPVTTASPAGGTYTSAQTVTLTRNEAGTTFYCTGSSTCTPSTTYSAPVTISGSTTLRFYSRDSAGNTETTKSATYTINIPQATDHSGLTWTGSYTICQQCHSTEVNDVLNSVHYQWKGSAAEMTSGTTSQGKIVQRDASGKIITGASAMNAYCVNVLGNWAGCGSCHVGLGAEPTATNKDNIDCLLCHQKDYKRVKVNGVFQPDPTMTITMDQALRTLHRPVRANCLQCHAKAGGGDAVKRGDMALANATTTDRNYDVHMASTANGNIVCQQCHTYTNHKVAGRGSDIRPIDSTVAVSCSTSTCHSGKSGTSGHSTSAVNRHVNRVACQTCHIPTYAKNAADTAATEATETHRDWTVPEYNATAKRWEPTPTKANNLRPVYAHWNGTSWGSNLNDAPTAVSGVYLLSEPEGGVNVANSKLYPFKYKTAKQPYAASLNVLIAIDTAKYWAFAIPPYVPTATDVDATVRQGLTNMGYASTTAYTWVTTAEYQLLSHQVSPSANVLQCTSCHVSGTATQMNLQSLGYGLKKPTSDLCNDCHSLESYTSSYNNFTSVHSRHTSRTNCSSCHNFSR